MRHLMMSFFALLVFTQAQAAAPQKDRDQMKGELEKKGYFKNATCAEIASSILKQNGLPALGENAPINGKRGGFDRSNEKAAYPKFFDQVSSTDGSTIKISAAPGKAGWNLTLHREGPKDPGFLIETVMTFEKANRGGREVCDLVGFNVKTRAEKKNSKDLESFKYSMNQCLDTYLQNPEMKVERSISSVSAPIQWVAADCAFAVHFWKDTK